jgi:hypothetical protein
MEKKGSGFDPDYFRSAVINVAPTIRFNIFYTEAITMKDVQVIEKAYLNMTELHSSLLNYVFQHAI